MFRSSLKSLFASRVGTLRVVGAWLCLAVVAMLWMPVLAAAWNAHVMACCDGTMCTVQGHRHSKQTEKPSSNPGVPMDCEHSQAGSTMNCAMSCCHQQEQFTATGTVFVLPEVENHAELFLIESSVFLPGTKQVTALFGPLSPPPRSSSSVA
jgi:hypothetical protein